MAKRAKKEMIFHFDLVIRGNPIGFKADVRARSKAEAVKILNKSIANKTLEEVMRGKPDDRIEDLSISFGRVSSIDIDGASEVGEDACDIAEDDDERNDE